MPTERETNAPEGSRRDKGMSEISDSHKAIAHLVPAGRQIAYLDYALTNNVGDQLIVLGTLQFFRKYGIQRRFSRNVSNSEPVGKLPLQEDDIVVLHGGGNMGDIYPHFQRYREEIIGHYRDHKIIVMPQTVHFKEPDALPRAAEKMNRHPDLTLFVRDQPSLALTKPFFGERVHLMPDMAHQLWPVLHLAAGDERTPARGPLMLMRTDVEQGDLPGPIAALSDQFTDWDRILSTGFRATKRLVRMVSQVGFAKRTGVDFDELYFQAIEKEVVRNLKGPVRIAAMAHVEAAWGHPWDAFEKACACRGQQLRQELCLFASLEPLP